MGMTIDEIIDDLTELKICGVVPFTKGTISEGNYKVITEQSLNEAIDIMRKYQKIKQIHQDWFKTLTSAEAYTQISEVVEDGND